MTSQSQVRFVAELSLNSPANSKSDCKAPVKLNWRGIRPCSLAAHAISARTTLYAASVMPISLRTISGVLHRRTSMPKAVLIERRLSSACHLWRYNYDIYAFLYNSGSKSVVTMSSTRVRKPVSGLALAATEPQESLEFVHT